MNSSPQHVVVTGASTGIGAACAVWLAQRGWLVWAGVRRTEDGDRLRTQGGENIRPLHLDVTVPDTLARAADEVGAALSEQGLAGLVNNAGIAVAGPLEFVGAGQLRQQFEVNVIGLVAATQAFLPLLRRWPGRIVHMGSTSGRLALPFLGPYAASKFAVEALSDAQRGELRPWGIEVINVQPGAVATPIWDKARQSNEAQFADLPAEAQALYQRPIDRLRAQTAQAANRAIPAVRVAAVVERALTARRPRTRYPVGGDARLQFLIRRLPDRWRDALIGRMLFGGKAAE